MGRPRKVKTQEEVPIAEPVAESKPIQASGSDVRLREVEIKRLDVVLAGLRKEQVELRANIDLSKRSQLLNIEMKIKEAKEKDLESQENVEKSRKAVNEARVEKQKVVELREYLEKEKAIVDEKVSYLKEIVAKL